METASTNQVRSYVSRIRQRKAEARAINDDVRAIYAEAKEAGLNKTALGDLVAYVEKREKDPDAVVARSALFDRYLIEHDGMKNATHAHAHANEAVVVVTERLSAPGPMPPGHSNTTAGDPAELGSSVSKGVARSPDCLKPEMCGSFTWRKLCHRCEKAAASRTQEKSGTSMAQN